MERMGQLLAGCWLAGWEIELLLCGVDGLWLLGLKRENEAIVFYATCVGLVLLVGARSVYTR